MKVKLISEPCKCSVKHEVEVEVDELKTYFSFPHIYCKKCHYSLEFIVDNDSPLHTYIPKKI